MSGLPPAADVVEQVLTAAAAAGSGDCVVLVEEAHEAEVRFANNTTTTNGVRLDRRVTAIRFVDVDGGPSKGGIAAGVARRAGDVDARSLVAAADADARGAGPADDAAPLVRGSADADFDDAAGLDRPRRARRCPHRPGRWLRPGPGGRAGARRLRRAPGGDDVPRQHDRPAPAPRAADRRAAPGRPDRRRHPVGLGRRGHRGLRRRHTRATSKRASSRGSSGPGGGSTARPAGTRRSCRPAAVADLMVGLVEAAGGQQAEEGRHGLLGAGRRDPGRRRPVGPPVRPVRRPGRARAGVRAVPDRAGIGPERVGLRQRSPARTGRTGCGAAGSSA